MRYQHSTQPQISHRDSTAAMRDSGLFGSSAMFADDSLLSATRDTDMSDSVFCSLIMLALRRDEKSPLSRTMTRLLGLSRDDEVILTKQIGILDGEDLHSLIVSIKPDTDDVILVTKTSSMMDIYLTDSCCRLRAAATLQRDCDQPELITNKDAVVAFACELESWKILAKKMSHLCFLKSYMQRTCRFEI